MLPLARVPGVTPRPLIAALAIALAAIASGCATFTDSNNVARVGDETLSNDELREIVSAITGTPIGETTDGVNGINFVGNADNGDTHNRSVLASRSRGARLSESTRLTWLFSASFAEFSAI